MNDAEVRLKVTADSKDSEKGLDSFNRKAQDTPRHLDKIKAVGVKAFKAMAAATAAASVAIGGLVMKAVKSYAELEQNIGGVETLFKENANAVIQNAKNAYKTAGMSANAYMQNVTSFSASLLQSLSGDTKKAAEYADRAMVDMSDNANKMGTSMEMITNAYQGFAKQNYTMLDNLKLGYGGTQTEMQRLISDASKMTDIQKKLGVTVDENSMSFGNIVNAISVMQNSMDISGYSAAELNKKLKEMTLTEEELKKVATDMGITYEEVAKKMKDGSLTAKDASILLGTTAREAVTTISGSINMMKASFDNFLNGSGSVEQFIESFETVLNNVVPAIKKLGPDIIKGLIQIVNYIAVELPGLIQTLLPALVKGAINLVIGLVSVIPKLIGELAKMLPKIIKSLINGLKKVVDQLSTMIPKLIPQIVNAIVKAVPLLIQGVSEVINQLARIMPTLIPQLVNAILDIIPALLENLPLIVQAGIQLTMGILQGLVTAIPILVAKLPLIIQSIINTLIGLLPQIIMMAPQIIMAIITGLIEAIPLLVDMAPQIIMGLIEGMFKGFQQLFLVGGKIISNIWNGISKAVPNLLSKIPIIPKGVIDKINNGFANIGNIGKNLMLGLWNGMSGLKSWVISKVRAMGASIIKGLKNALGIRSPSREFAWIGKMNVIGLEEGMEKMKPSLDDTVDKIVNLDYDTSGLDFLTNGSVKISSDFGDSASGNIFNDNNIHVNVIADMDVDKFGKAFVRDIKTFSGGSKNSYNYGGSN